MSLQTVWEVLGLTLVNGMISLTTITFVTGMMRKNKSAVSAQLHRPDNDIIHG